MFSCSHRKKHYWLHSIVKISQIGCIQQCDISMNPTAMDFNVHIFNSLAYNPKSFFFIFTSLGIVLIYKLVQTRGIIFPQEAIYIFRRCTDINWYEFRHISCVAGWGYWSPVLKETHGRSYTQANLSVLPALRANNQSNF